MTNERAADVLTRKDACFASVKWVGDRSVEHAWRECMRGDWLIWIAAKLGIERVTIVMAAIEIARETLVSAGDNRPKLALELAEAWMRGGVDLEDVKKASADALASYCAATSAACGAAAYAAYAAHAASTAAIYSRDDSTEAAYALASNAVHAAAYSAPNSDSRNALLARSADIVREFITIDMIKEKCT